MATTRGRGAETHEGDLARGYRGVALWVAPNVVILSAGLLGPFGALTYIEAVSLMAIGAAWFGPLCLLNAIRCGRVHCWVAGIALPTWAAAGVFEGFRVLPLSLSLYYVFLWGLVFLAFIVEWVIGPYFRRPSPSR